MVFSLQYRGQLNKTKIYTHSSDKIQTSDSDLIRNVSYDFSREGSVQRSWILYELATLPYFTSFYPFFTLLYPTQPYFTEPYPRLHSILLYSTLLYSTLSITVHRHITHTRLKNGTILHAT